MGEGVLAKQCLKKEAFPQRAEPDPNKQNRGARSNTQGRDREEGGRLLSKRSTKLCNKQTHGTEEMGLGSELSITRSIQAREDDQLSGKAQIMFTARRKVTNISEPQILS